MVMGSDENALITVIIPAYNAEKQLYRAVESVLGQTYKNLEILIIDDGSQDGTGAIADSYAKSDSRIVVFHVENGGEARSRNLGLSKAKGDYIAFCDADDYMHPEMLEKMYGAIIRDSSDIAICSWKYVDENGVKLNWRTPNLKSCVMSSREAQIQFLQSGNIEGFCWNKLFRKQLYGAAGDIQYDVRRLSYCDILANYRVIQNAKRVSYLGEQLYDYYQISTACTHTPNIKKNYDYVETMEEVFAEATAAGLVNQGKIYKTYRLITHLFGMVKNRKLYDEDAFYKHFIMVYDKHLRVAFPKKIYYAIRYPLENPLKFAMKAWMVKVFYRRCSKKCNK